VAGAYPDLAAQAPEQALRLSEQAESLFPAPVVELELSASLDRVSTVDPNVKTAKWLSISE
jgi:hypothetical protein